MANIREVDSFEGLLKKIKQAGIDILFIDHVSGQPKGSVETTYALVFSANLDPHETRFFRKIIGSSAGRNGMGPAAVETELAKEYDLVRRQDLKPMRGVASLEAARVILTLPF